jgi:hypothetical protein
MDVVMSLARLNAPIVVSLAPMGFYASWCRLVRHLGLQVLLDVVAGKSAWRYYGDRQPHCGGCQSVSHDVLPLFSR